MECQTPNGASVLYSCPPGFMEHLQREYGRARSQQRQRSRSTFGADWTIAAVTPAQDGTKLGQAISQGLGGS